MSEILTENIYYLGPDGSNAHSAMLRFLTLCGIKPNNKSPQRSIKSALEALEHDKSSLCVLPIENSIEGIVRETIDNLLKIEDNNIRILGEISLPIRHMLLSKGTDSGKIKKVISHPQALAQCSLYLYKNLPGAELKEVSSTSYAAQKAAEDESLETAAIANETCANLFGLNILASDINDEIDNKTRFYLLGRNKFENKKPGKTAVILSTKNHAGALCDVLKVFSKYKINLTYIDSRPSKRQLGEYLFFMELEGYAAEPQIESALQEMTSYVNFYKVLGSFGKFN